MFNVKIARLSKPKQNDKTNLTKLAFIAVLLIPIISCAPSDKLNSLNITARQLAFPTGYYNHVVYIEDRLVGFTVNREPPEKRISFAYEGDKEATPFNPEDDPLCVNYSYFEVVNLLPDGRLGLWKECDDGSAVTAYLSTNRSIFAFDWHTGELEQLVDGKLSQGSDPKFYTWNPEMTLGVQETGPGYPGTIYWIKPDG